MMTISGEALKLYYSLSEMEIKATAISILKSLFPDQTVPEPVLVLCSHWGTDPFIKMSYSYVSVNGESEDYDVMSQEELMGRVHFAGEVRRKNREERVCICMKSEIREREGGRLLKIAKRDIKTKKTSDKDECIL